MATATWNDSFEFLVEHWEELHELDIMRLLGSLDHADATQHRAILALGQGLSSSDLFAIVTETLMASSAVLAALQKPSVELALILVQANPDVLNPAGSGLADMGTRAALNALLDLASGEEDRAAAQLSAFVAKAGDQGRQESLALLKRYMTGAQEGAVDAKPLLHCLEQI